MKKIIMLLMILTASLAFNIKDTAASNVAITPEYKNDFNDLPRLADDDIEVNPIVSYNRATGEYTLDFNFRTRRIIVTTTQMPHMAHPEFAEKYAGVLPRYIKYYSVQPRSTGDRILWYDFQNNPADGKIMAEIGDNEVNGFRPFISWNIDKSEINGTSKLLLYGVPTQSNDSIFFDIVFPMQLDELLQITIVYDVRSKYFWGIDGKWVTKKITRVLGETAWRYDIDDIIFGQWVQFWTYRDRVQHITDVANLYSDNVSKTKYVEKINDYIDKKNLTDSQVTVSRVFSNNNSIYRIFADTVSGFGQTKLETSLASVVEVLYVFQGEFFFIAEEDIISIIADGQWGNEVNLGIPKWLMDLWNEYYWIVIGFVGLLVAAILLPIFIPAIKPLFEMIANGITTLIISIINGFVSLIRLILDVILFIPRLLFSKKRRR